MWEKNAYAGARLKEVRRDLLDRKDDIAVGQVVDHAGTDCAIVVVAEDPGRRGLDAYVQTVLVDERANSRGGQRHSPLPAVLILMPDPDAIHGSDYGRCDSRPGHGGDRSALCDGSSVS